MIRRIFITLCLFSLLVIPVSRESLVSTTSATPNICSLPTTSFKAYCGSAVLKEALGNLGVETLLQEKLIKNLDSLADQKLGFNCLYEIKEAAKEAGLHTLTVETDLASLETLTQHAQVITNITGNRHFCVVESVSKEDVLVYIPGLNYEYPKMTLEEFGDYWDKVVLLISKEKIDLEKPNFSFKYASDEQTREIIGAQGCGNVSGRAGNATGAWGGVRWGMGNASSFVNSFTTSDPVVLNSGNLFLEVEDVNIPTKGLPLELTRFYNAEIVSEVPGWLPEPGAGSWVIEDGEYSGQGDRSSSDLVADDFTLELDMQTIQPGSNHSWETAWVNIRYQEDAADPRKARNCYYFLIHTNGKIELAKWKDGTQYWLFNKSTGYSAANKNRIRIEAYGANIKVYINGNLEINYTDPNPVLGQGRIALQSYFSHAHFDNIYIAAADGSTHNYDFNADDNEFIFGYGWTHTYNWRVVQYPTHITVIEPNNLKQIYLPLADGTFQPIPLENHQEFTKDGGGYSLRTKHGTHYRFDTQGSLAYIEDRNLNRTELNYSDIGGRRLLTSVIEPTGRTITLSYGANNQVSRVTDPAGAFLQYFYDAAGQLTAAVDRNGNQTLYGYDPVTHNLTQLTDPEGNIYTYTYLYNDRVNDQTDPLGQKTTFDYLWTTTHVINNSGKVYKYNFDENRFLQSITNPQNRMERTINDENGDPINYYDYKGNRTYYTYDGSGNRTGIYNAQQKWTTFTYEPNYNQIINSTDARGSVTVFSYDAKANLLQSVDAEAGSVDYTYNGFGQVISVKDSRGKITSFNYDTYGNLISKTDPQNNITTYTYDILGRLTKVTDAQGKSTEYTYDKNGNPLSVKDALGNIARYTYTPQDKLFSVTDPLDNTTDYTYDCFGNLLSVADAQGNTTTYTYDTENQMHFNKANLLSIIDTRGNTSLYQYDSLDRLINTTDAAGASYQFGYDRQGNITTRQDTTGATTTYYYDNLNRLYKVKDPQGLLFHYTYDEVGNLTEVSDYADHLYYTYDRLSRITSQAYLDGTRMAYTYDANGNRVSLEVSGLGEVFYTHDSLNRLTRINLPDGRTTEFSYDELSRRTQVIYPNAATASYAYDALGRLTQLVNKDPQASEFSRFVYAYDANSRRTRMDSSKGTTSYTYDELNQLLSEQGAMDSQNLSSIYSYDEVGNRLSLFEDNLITNYAYNTLNQPISSTIVPQKLISVEGTVLDENPVSVSVNGIPATLSGTQFTAENVPLNPGVNTLRAEATDTAGNTGVHEITVTYQAFLPTATTEYSFDTNGNLIGKTSAGTTETFIYDHENRLKTYTSPTASASYVYNGEGRRLSKTVNGLTTKYYYDGAEVILERGPSGDIYYIHGPRIDELIVDSRGYSYHTDGLGSVVNLTDSSGNQASSYSYNAFGNLTGSTGTVTNPWLYTGRYLDNESGLYYYRNRYYDPKVGRFITRDPSLLLNALSGVVPYLLPQQLGSPQQLHKYLYCINNPVNWIDPWGLEGGGPLHYVRRYSNLYDVVCRGLGLNERVYSYLINHGSIDITLNAGTGIVGASGQLSITTTGIKGYVGAGWGIGTGISVTGGPNFGESSGWAVRASVSGGGGFGGTASGTISQGGNSVNMGIGGGVGAGATLTVGYGGTIWDW